jgi:hypothetical protein
VELLELLRVDAPVMALEPGVEVPSLPLVLLHGMREGHRIAGRCHEGLRAGIPSIPCVEKVLYRKVDLPNEFPTFGLRKGDSRYREIVMDGAVRELLDELGQRIVDEEFVDALLRFDVELRIPVQAPRRLVVHAFAEDARMVLESLRCRDEVVQPSHHLL